MKLIFSKAVDDNRQRNEGFKLARALIMQALVMCARKLTQAHAKQRTSQQYSSNYSPEVEIESEFKENIVWNSFINRNIALPFFKDNQGCKFVRANKSIALKFTHAQIVILANSYCCP